MTYRHDLWEIAAEYHGIVTTRQAEDAGVPAVEVRKLAARGALERLGYGVYGTRVSRPISGQSWRPQQQSPAKTPSSKATPCWQCSGWRWSTHPRSTSVRRGDDAASRRVTPSSPSGRTCPKAT